jgi:hypothetical protein
MKDTNTLARQAFEAIGAAQDALRALSASFETDEYTDFPKFTAEDYFDMIHELEYDATSLVRIRNHTAKLVRKTNKEN